MIIAHICSRASCRRGGLVPTVSCGYCTVSAIVNEWLTAPLVAVTITL